MEGLCPECQAHTIIMVAEFQKQNHVLWETVELIVTLMKGRSGLHPRRVAQVLYALWTHRGLEDPGWFLCPSTGNCSSDSPSAVHLFFLAGFLMSSGCEIGSGASQQHPRCWYDRSR